MANEKLTMKIGSGLGEILLDIAQNHISRGDCEKAITTYTDSLHGFTEEYALMCLKNKAVLVVDEENQLVDLIDDNEELLKENAARVYDWNCVIKNQINTLDSLRDKRLHIIDNFNTYYHGNIEDYSINEMMLRYFNEDQLKTIGKHHIAARLIASPDTKLYNKQTGNPQDVWDRMAYAIECEDPEEPNENISNWERVLYYTVEYVKTIKLLHQEFVKFDKMYHFLLNHGLIEHVKFIESKAECICDILEIFSDDNHGYYNILCDEELHNYKEHLYGDLLHTTFGNEYCKNGILKKEMLDGYDAGWLSPLGEYYAGNGETSSMIHMNIAEQIFNSATNMYAVRMAKDGVSIWSSNSPEQWLSSHGWVKIHHNDCYGSFIGERNPDKRTPEFPYYYCPTKIQVKMICDYADKFYKGKFYTEANCFGRDFHPDPFSTYKVRQMDEFKLHEIFGY